MINGVLLRLKPMKVSILNSICMPNLYTGSPKEGLPNSEADNRQNKIDPECFDKVKKRGMIAVDRLLESCKKILLG